MIEALQQIAAQPGIAPYKGIAVAFALGLLVGVQRGWAQRAAADGTRFAGVRTYGLLGLAGGVGGALAGAAPVLAAIVLASAAGLILIGYARSTQGGGPISGTASLVGLLTMACGYLAATGAVLVATAIAVAMALLLSLREPLHSLVERMTEREIAAFIRFALIALVILPLLPDRHFGPFQAWNPRELWLVVVLVCGFSLVGYVAARQLGASRGTIATAAAGAMVSSTAVTVAMAGRLKAEPGNAPILHAGVAAASAVMFARVMGLTALLAPFALPALAITAVPGMVASLACAAWFLHAAGHAPPHAEAAMPLRNPFDIGPALFLMALVMLMSLAARWVLDRFGDAGLALVLALSGTLDVDSAIITMGGLPSGAIDPRTAGLVLLPPVLLNTWFKAAAAISVAGWRHARPSVIALVASTVAALAGLPFVR